MIRDEILKAYSKTKIVALDDGETLVRILAVELLKLYKEQDAVI